MSWHALPLRGSGAFCFTMSTNNDDDIEQYDQWIFSDWHHPESNAVSESSSDEAGDDSMGDSEVGSPPWELWFHQMLRRAMIMLEC